MDDIMAVIEQEATEDFQLMAGPLITTIMDAMSLLVYFAVARSLLGL